MTQHSQMSLKGAPRSTVNALKNLAPNHAHIQREQLLSIFFQFQGYHMKTFSLHHAQECRPVLHFSLVSFACESQDNPRPLHKTDEVFDCLQHCCETCDVNLGTREKPSEKPFN